MAEKQEFSSYSHGGVTNSGYSKSEYGAGYSSLSTNESQQTPVENQPLKANNSKEPAIDSLKLAIFATICCFWPTGIFAIMRASQARALAAGGDLDGSQKAARKARQLSLTSVCIGISLVIIYLVVYFGIMGH